MAGSLDLEAFRKAQRADGPATILAISIANPPNVVAQSSYPDYYFRVTNNEHMTELKHKFQRMCKNFPIESQFHFCKSYNAMIITLHY